MNNCDGCQAGMRVEQGIHVKDCRWCGGTGHVQHRNDWTATTQICTSCRGSGRHLHMGCTRMNYTTGESQ